MTRRARPRALAVLCVAVALSAACAPSSDSPPRPVAQQTADARIRVLTSGTPAVPPRPTATPLPGPTCPGAVWWYDAASRVGERTTVQGPVAAARAVGGGLLLDLGQPYPDPNRAVARLAAPGPAQADAFVGKSVCATGQVTLIDGVATVDAATASDISAR